MQAAAGGHHRADDREVPVAPAERALAAQAQDLPARNHEVDPPHAERERDPCHRHQAGVERPARALGTHHRGERGDRADHALAQGDDDQQAVALGDVVRVPGSAALAVLRDPRPGELDQQQRRRPREHAGHRRVGDRERHPAHLRDQDRLEVGKAGRAPLRILARGAAPLEHHRDPHDHVAGHHHAVVDGLALVDRVEHVRQAERQHHHPDHLHHRGQAVDPVVGVVGRREPGEVDPGPGDGEGAEAEADQAGADVVLGQEVGQLVGHDPEGDHEGEVEQQLERGGRAVRLVGVAPAHAQAAVCSGRLIGAV